MTNVDISAVEELGMEPDRQGIITWHSMQDQT